MSVFSCLRKDPARRTCAVPPRRSFDGFLGYATLVDVGSTLVGDSLAPPASGITVYPVIAEVPTDWKIVSESLNKQNPFVLANPTAPVSKALENLANALVAQKRK